MVIKLLWWFLGLFVAATFPTQAQSQNSAAALPSVEQILDKYEQAIGGRSAWEKIRSLHEIDTIELPKTDETGVSNKWLAPDRFYAVVTRGGATFKAGFDGEAGWASSPQFGLKTLNGKDLVLARRTAVFPREIRFRELASQILLKGKARVNQLDTYVVELRFSEGDIRTMYFDSKTWLKVREDVETPALPESEKLETYFDDYRDLPDQKIKYPFRVTNKSKYIGVERVKELHFNVPVDESLFKIPSSHIYIQR